MSVEEMYAVIQIASILVGVIWTIAEIKNSGKQTHKEVSELKIDIRDVKSALEDQKDFIHDVDVRLAKVETFRGGNHKF